MDGDGALDTADEELLEGHRRDQRQVARADVRGHQRAAGDARADHRRLPPEDAAAGVADCRAAEQRANLPDHRDDGGVGGGFVGLAFEEGRIEVLRAVRARVKARHDNHHVDEQDLVLLERGLSFARECPEPVPLLISGCVGAVSACLVSRSTFWTWKWLVSGRKKRNVTTRRGGPAPNQNKLR